MNQDIKTSDEAKKYCKEICMKLIQKHQDVIEKTFEIIDLDILDSEIKKVIEDNNEQNEKKFLDKIQTRKKALDTVEDSIDKIDLLSRHLEESEKKEGIKTEEDNSGKSPVKMFSKKN